MSPTWAVRNFPRARAARKRAACNAVPRSREAHMQASERGVRRPAEIATPSAAPKSPPAAAPSRIRPARILLDRAMCSASADPAAQTPAKLLSSWEIGWGRLSSGRPGTDIIALQINGLYEYRQFAA